MPPGKRGSGINTSPHDLTLRLPVGSGQKMERARACRDIRMDIMRVWEGPFRSRQQQCPAACCAWLDAKAA